jgi:hypothetical protein
MRLVEKGMWEGGTELFMCFHSTLGDHDVTLSMVE